MPTAKMCMPLGGAEPGLGSVTAWTVLAGAIGTPA